jgi:hypothetical protein
MIHNESSPLAGKTVRIKAGYIHSQVENFAGSEFRVEDWWDRVSGISWMFQKGNPACLVYSLRIVPNFLPLNDEVLYGKIGPFGHLVHITEIEIPKEEKP